MKIQNKCLAKALITLLFFVSAFHAQAQYCSGTTNLTTSSGSFTDGSGSNSYTNNTSCSWLIQPSTAATSITLSFSAFQLESCCDYVRIYDGNSTSAPLLGSYNGTSIPPSHTSSGGSMYVTFTTDGSVTYQGWSASYTSVAACTTTTPTITASGPTSFCGGGSVTLTSSSASTYLWSNGATTQSITVTQSGDYTVFVTDANGCGATSAPVTVTNNGPTVSASADPVSVCAGGITQLNASAGSALQENFDPINTAQWASTTGAAESAFCGSVSGNALYFNGSSTREAITQNLNVSGGGSLNFYLKISNTFSSGCETADPGDEVLLQYSTNNGSTWTTINTYNTGVTYQDFTLVNVTIPTGAQTSATKFKWMQPYHAGSGYDNWAIDDISITGTGSGSYSYSWSPTTGVSDPAIANPTATVSANTTYTVTVTDINSGCTNSASVAVSTFTPPTATITASGSTTFCQGDSVLLSANTGIAYLWSTGATTQSIYASQSGNYTVTVTYTGGCTSTSAATTVTVNTTATPTITASGPTSFCGGGSVTLTSSSASTYLWSNGATTQSITVTQSGDYTVFVTDANGCTATSAPVTVTNNEPTVSASANPASVCAGGTTQLSASAGSALQEDFDPTNTAQWSSITGTASTSCGSVSGNALYFNSSTTREAVTQNLNVSGGGTISFYLKIAYGTTSGCERADSGEDVLLQYSTNGGSTWATVNTYYTGTTYQNFTLINVTIPTGAQTTSTKFKWTQSSHSGSGFDNWAIDDVAITGTGSGSYSYGWSPTTGVSDPAIANPTATVSSNTTYTVTVTDNNSGCTNSASAAVSTFTPPTATITASGSTTFCSGGSVILTANTGLGYLWSTGDTMQTITVAQSGNYTVTVTYAGGCTSTSAATAVTVNTAATPTITASGPTSFCGGGSVTLTSSSASSYLWSSGATTQSITVSQSGSYEVRITDANGCTATSAPVTVTNNGPTVSASATPVSVCTGGTTQLSTTTNTNVIDEKFDPINSAQWVSTTGGAVSTSCGSVSGNALYFNGSSTREAVTKSVDVSAGGTINFSLKIAYNTSSPCTHTYYGNDIYLEYSTNGGSSWYYINTYYGGYSTYQNFTTVSVTIPNGAKTTATRFRWRQTYHYGMGSDNWALDNITITGNNTSSHSYSWSPTTGVSDPAIANPTATVSANTTYTVTVTDINSGCTNSASAAVTALPVPVATITANGPTSFCTGGSVLLTTSTGAGYIYQWKKNGNNISGATASSYTVTTSGEYSVMITASSCSATSSSILVTVASGPYASITVDGPTTFCAGGSVALTANQGSSYLWSNGETTQSIAVMITGNYTVTVTNPGGCSGSAISQGVSVTVNPLPPTPYYTQSGNTYISSSATGNQWYLDGNLINGATSQTLTSSLPGVYTVTVTDANGCTSLPGSLGTGVGEKQLDESTFKAYPNPFNNETTIFYTLNGKSAVTLEVYNVLGEKIAVLANEEQAAGEHTYKLSTYATGIYVVHLRAGNHTYTQKVVAVR